MQLSPESQSRHKLKKTKVKRKGWTDKQQTKENEGQQPHQPASLNQNPTWQKSHLKQSLEMKNKL